MFRTKVTVVLSDDYEFTPEESPVSDTFVGMLVAFDPSRKTFAVLGMNGTRFRFGVHQCSSVVRQVDGADLLYRLNTSNEDGDLSYAAWRMERVTSPKEQRREAENEAWHLAVRAAKRSKAAAQTDAQIAERRRRTEEIDVAVAQAAAAKLKIEAEYSAWRESIEAHRFARFNNPDVDEARARLAQLTAERGVAVRVGIISVSLRRVIGSVGDCVALTDEERAQLRDCAVARLVGPQRDQCWYRVMWPGLGVGEFSFGPAPVGRQQYMVRFAAHVPDVTRGANWRSAGAGYVLHQHTPLDIDAPPSYMGHVPPPGYPTSTQYEHLVRGANAPSEARDLARSHTTIRVGRRRRESADLRSLMWQAQYANKVLHTRRLARERDAREEVERLTHHASEGGLDVFVETLEVGGDRPEQDAILG